MLCILHFFQQHDLDIMHQELYHFFIAANFPLFTYNQLCSFLNGIFFITYLISFSFLILPRSVLKICILIRNYPFPSTFSKLLPQSCIYYSLIIILTSSISMVTALFPLLILYISTLLTLIRHGRAYWSFQRNSWWILFYLNSLRFLVW